MKRTFFTAAPLKLSMLSLAGLLTFTACTDDQVDPIEQVPTTYNFENVDYSGQTARIQMLNELEGSAKAGASEQVSAAELQAIFENTNKLFGTDKDIKSKTHVDAVPEMEAYFASIDTLSGNPDNVIGGRLYDQQGVEPAQMIAKGLMGALLYHQATAVYLGDDKMNVDNETVTEGKGTKMQHHWDEAFGYFGAPVDFLTNDGSSATDDPQTKTWYWAKYANSRSKVIDVRDEIFNAFLSGRTAINNKDMEGRDAAIQTIRENWEKLAAANVVHYVNSSISDLDAGETGDFYHHWSEGKAFLNTLWYNPARKITNQQMEELNALFGENPKATDKAKLQQANDKLQQIFGFSTAEMGNL